MSIFNFKEFSIHHCPEVMKVSTDSVILGAWSETNRGPVLDLGCGTGLLSLMVAQKNSNLIIDAIDNNLKACTCAAENFKRSPFAERLNVIQTDFRDLCTKEKYNHIITNPPYFFGLTKATTAERNSYRHTNYDFWKDFWKTCDFLLTDEGTLEMILPYDRSTQLLSTMDDSKCFEVHRALLVNHQKDTKPVLICLSFRKKASRMTNFNILPIYKHNGEWSMAYKKLCKDFYLNI